MESINVAIPIKTPPCKPCEIQTGPHRHKTMSPVTKRLFYKRNKLTLLPHSPIFSPNNGVLRFQVAKCSWLPVHCFITFGRNWHQQVLAWSTGGPSSMTHFFWCPDAFKPTTYYQKQAHEITQSVICVSHWSLSLPYIEPLTIFNITIFWLYQYVLTWQPYSFTWKTFDRRYPTWLSRGARISVTTSD